jgi:hypothetical protein
MNEKQPAFTVFEFRCACNQPLKIGRQTIAEWSDTNPTFIGIACSECNQVLRYKVQEAKTHVADELPVATMISVGSKCEQADCDEKLVIFANFAIPIDDKERFAKLPSLKSELVCPRGHRITTLWNESL